VSSDAGWISSADTSQRSLPAANRALLKEDAMPEIECFFDCASPWSYLAFHNLPAVAREFDADIAWRPSLAGGVFKAINPSVQAARDHPVPPKLAYMHKDLQDWAREAGLRIIFPPTVFPANSVKAMRGCLALEPEGKLVAFAHAVFDAYWTEDQDIFRPDVLAAICRRIGTDSDHFFAAIEAPAIKDGLRANTQELMDRGGFGVPTIFVGGTDMFFGNDRLALVRAALQRRRAGG
jgi:2-hydroxychromene-2-carboxylate isomerase